MLGKYESLYNEYEFGILEGISVLISISRGIKPW